MKVLSLIVSGKRTEVTYLKTEAFKRVKQLEA